MSRNRAPCRPPTFIRATGCGSRGGTGRQQCLLRSGACSNSTWTARNSNCLIGKSCRSSPFAGRQNTYHGPGWSADLSEESGASDRLNIIGLRVNEGLGEVERFIDHAGIIGLSIVTIIHGLGTGALKSAVTDYLKNHPLIASIRPGEPAEGGAGVTVAELKK